MARLPRLALDQQLHQLRHAAVPGREVFGTEADCADFISVLLEVSRQSDVAIHAYVLLPQSVGMLLTPRHGSQLAPMMQRLGRRFVGLHNRRHGVAGSPWAGRYQTAVLQPSLYLLEAMCQLESQPVSMGLVNRSEDWRHSSAAHHAGLRFDPLVTDHPVFWAQGNTPFERELAYRRFCGSARSESVARRIDEATSKGWAIGTADFIEHLSAQQTRRLSPSPRGRPRRLASDQSDPV